jgi:hypothetical protein
MAAEDSGVAGERGEEMEKDGRGVVFFSCWFSSACWDISSTRRSKLHLEQGDESLGRGQGDSGAVDGEVGDQGVVIPMILRLLIRGRDMDMEPTRDGDLVSGVEHWEEQLLGTWLGIEGTGKNPQHNPVILGLVVIMGDTITPLDEALQALAPLLDMKARDLARHQEGRSKNFVVYSSSYKHCTQRSGRFPKGNSSVNAFAA